MGSPEAVNACIQPAPADQTTVWNHFPPVSTCILASVSGTDGAFVSIQDSWTLVDWQRAGGLGVHHIFGRKDTRDGDIRLALFADQKFPDEHSLVRQDLRDRYAHQSSGARLGPPAAPVSLAASHGPAHSSRNSSP